MRSYITELPNFVYYFVWSIVEELTSQLLAHDSCSFLKSWLDIFEYCLYEIFLDQVFTVCFCSRANFTSAATDEKFKWKGLNPHIYINLHPCMKIFFDRPRMQLNLKFILIHNHHNKTILLDIPRVLQFPVLMFDKACWFVNVFCNLHYLIFIIGFSFWSPFYELKVIKPKTEKEFVSNWSIVDL